MGIERRTQSWKQLQYVPIKSVLPFVELLFAAYFTYFLITALARGQWASVPFLVLFQIGFLYTGLLSIVQQYAGDNVVLEPATEEEI